MLYKIKTRESVERIDISKVSYIGRSLDSCVLILILDGTKVEMEMNSINHLELVEERLILAWEHEKGEDVIDIMDWPTEEAPKEIVIKESDKRTKEVNEILLGPGGYKEVVPKTNTSL